MCFLFFLISCCYPKNIKIQVIERADVAHKFIYTLRYSLYKLQVPILTTTTILEWMDVDIFYKYGIDMLFMW